MKRSFYTQLIKYIFLPAVLILFAGYGSTAQTPVYVTQPLDHPNTSGQYYNNNSITLSPGFSANGSIGTFRAFISNSLPQAAPSPSTDQNFVSVWTPIIPVSTIPALKSLGYVTSDVNIAMTYSDGLGRTIQTVNVNVTPQNADLVQPHEYNNLGQELKKYLPYAAKTGSSSSYRPNATLGDQAGFYNDPSNTTIAQSPTPFSNVIYESSPLGRTVEQGSTGNAWQLTGSGAPNSGHTTKFEYLTNNQTAITDVDNTRMAVAYGVSFDSNGNRSLTINTSTGYYESGDLFVQVIKDANWVNGDGRNGTFENYNNKEGQTILKRHFIKNSSNVLEIISTYYVYDDFGALCYVLPQAANPDVLSGSNGVNISAGDLNTVCYQYQYDQKRRMIASRVPGKDWEYTVYNLLGQAVASQDGNQRTRNEWSVKKSDNLGRTVITGVWNSNISRNDLQQNILDQQTTFYESRTASGNGYTSSAWPQDLSDIYTVNYYDDYNVPNVPSGHTYQAYSGNPDGKSDLTQGLLTVTRSRVMSNPGQSLWTFSYYDAKGRIIQIQNTNHLSGDDLYNNEYDFSGKVLKSTHHHATPAGSLDIVNRFVYDHVGRERQHYEQIGTGAEVLLSQLSYNELGQVINKKLHQKSGNSKFLQSVDYRYNIHGALTSVNDPSLAANSITNPDDLNVSDADKFGITLKYDLADQPQYNGNIGSKQWATAAPPGSAQLSPVLKYDYAYDKMDRLVYAASSTGNTKDENFSEFLSYDKMGNILALSRWAKLAAGRTQIDNLNYQYNNNQVTRIDDASNNNTYGFSDNGGGTVSNQPNEYTYDLNGNLKSDLNKGISQITYNSFNLPVQVTWNDGRTLVYDYDGNGSKLKKTYTAGGSVFTTDYLGEIQYEQGQVAFVTTDEGLARRNTGNGNYVYQYFLKDQVGNTLAVIQPVYPSETIAELVQVTNYYPFGLDYRSDDPNMLFSYVSGPKNNYLFNGKELQDGTELYDFGARHYDPATGRWDAPDPANQMQDQSPYLAMGNNPVLYVDPDGRYFGLDDAVFAIIGGVFNLASNAISGNVHGFGSAISYFGVGAASAIATEYGGPMAGAAVMGAGNSIVSQVVANGWGHIDVGQVAMSTALSMGTSVLGGAISGAISPYTAALTSKIASPILSQMLSQGIGNAASGFLIGAGTSLIGGNSLGDAADAGLSSGVQGFAMGAMSGAVQGYQDAKAMDKNPWTGKSTAPVLEASIPKLGEIDLGSNYTARNFRDNLVNLTGENPKDADAHHMFPQKFGVEFKEIGVDIHAPENGAWWTRTIHSTNSRAWQNAWSGFLESNKNPTKQQTYDFARQLAAKYHLHVNFK